MALCSSRLKELTSLCARLPDVQSPPPLPPVSPLHVRNAALLQHLSRILVTMSATVTDLEKTVAHKAQVQTGGSNDLATLLGTYTQLLNQLNAICKDICLPMNSGETGMELHHYKIIVDEIRREVTSKERVTAADNVSLLHTSKIVDGDVAKVPIGVRFTLAVKRREAALKAQAERRKHLYSGGDEKEGGGFGGSAPNSGGNSRVMQSPLFANPPPRPANNTEDNSLRRRGGNQQQDDMLLQEQQQQQQLEEKPKYSRMDEAHKVEKTLSELTTMFSSLSNLIMSQGETITKIEDDTAYASLEIDSGGAEIQKLYSRTKGNRGIIIKTFAILILLLIIFKLY
ncbi:hypothetical protein TrVE_jg11061 [Triparma verrucosa]|uniref:t-SNARE coiled-coil homology domain-containing protein n=1 Tax=Triparma verrucosa TaxID=1606542 RepID=A0A9W7BQ66_9STRA|nr:hypothetical protein TrVE_jg11061 [Triparma verrucosa]